MLHSILTVLKTTGIMHHHVTTGKRDYFEFLPRHASMVQYASYIMNKKFEMVPQTKRLPPLTNKNALKLTRNIS
jgi:hypothetical protein